MAAHASIAQTLNAFEALTDADLLALRKAAAIRLRGTQYTEPTDLLYEALTRCLDGRRRWPMKVPFPLFLANAMKSIAHSDRESHDARRVDRESDLATLARPDPLAELAPSAPSAEDNAIAAEEFRIARARAEELQSAFKDDPAARAVVSGWLSELSSSELMAKHSLSPKEYDAARKRVARKAAAVARRYQ